MRFLRIRETKAKTGLANSTLYDLIQKGKFPKPVRLTDRCSAWIEEEIEKWQKQRVAERDGVTQ
jgi:prophage regulatory protein